MGRVGVLRKQAEQNNPAMMMAGPAGQGGLMMGIPGSVTAEEAAGNAMGRHFGENPNAFLNRNVAARDTNFTPQQMGRVQQGAQRAAAKFGGIGGALGAAFGGFNRLYDATSSGQAGALSAGAMGAWTGQQMAQPYATRLGAEVGVKRGARDERRKGQVAVKNAADARQRQEGMANYGQGAAAPHSSKGGEGMVRDHAFGSYSPVAKPTFDASMFNAPAPPPNIPSSPSLDRRIATKRADRAAANPPMSVADANATLAGGKNPIHTQGYPGFNPRMFNAEYKPPDPTAGTDVTGGTHDALQGAGFTGELQADPKTTQMDLSQYTGGKVGVKGKDTTQLIEHLNATSNDGTDEEGNNVSGKSRVSGG